MLYATYIVEKILPIYFINVNEEGYHQVIYIYEIRTK